jgi:AmmeMemoRadiSam system protein A
MDIHAVVRDHGDVLLAVAEEAIRRAFRGDWGWLPDPAEHPDALAEPGACFVTLERGPELLGCIGTLEATTPLVREVARKARAAAFDDPRFPPLNPLEFAEMTISVSVLSPLEELPVRSHGELVEAVRPGTDGLLVAAGGHRATFLPAVWRKLPTVGEFLGGLWVKAGLRPGTWPAGTLVFRYESGEVHASPPRPRLLTAVSASH